MATYYVDGAVGNDGNAGTSEGSGNAWATMQFAADTAVANDLVYVKASASYTEDVDFDTQNGSVGQPIVFEGYTTTPGDGGSATIEGSNSRAHCWSFNTRSYLTFKNFVLQGATAHPCDMITGATNYINFHNVRFTKGSATPTTSFARSAGFNSIQNSVFTNCEFDNFSGDGIGTAFGAQLKFIGCRFHDNGGDGADTNSAAGSAFFSCLFHDNTGDGIHMSGSVFEIIGCTIVNNGTHGIDLNGNNHTYSIIANNLIAGHNTAGDYGINSGAMAGTTKLTILNNAFYDNNTNIHANITTEAVLGASVSITDGSPFTNAAGDDYTLNNTASRGALARSAGFPAALGSLTNYLDIGALQAQPTAGGGGMMAHPGMSGRTNG